MEGKGDDLRDSVSYVVNHMPMSDKAFAALAAAIMKYDVETRKEKERDSPA